MIMPIESLADWDKRLARQDAFWNREILDRPVVCITQPRKDAGHPWPAAKKWPALRDRWTDTQHVAKCAVAGVMNTEYLGDALPSVYPNLGPEVFSAFFGQELEFSEGTSWSVPVLHDWAEVGKLKFSDQNFYWKKVNEMTDALLAVGHGKFYTGLTDLHPGGDAIAAFRDPINLNMDMIDAPEQVKELLAYINTTYFKVLDVFTGRLQKAGQAISTWAGIVSTKRWYVPSNDFSCMISPEMFDAMFLPGIAEECRHNEASLYHLDGPGAIKHLDSLLSIKELNAIQYICNPGERASDRIPLYKRCQAAGKGLQIGLAVNEVDLLMRELRPEGLWLSVYGVGDRDSAEAVIKAISNWR